MGIHEEKELVREEMRKKRDSLTSEEAAKNSFQVMYHLLKMSRYNDAKTVLFYSSKGNEVNTKEMIVKALMTGKKVLLPITNMAKEELEVAEIRNYDRDLKVGAFGILEPKIRTESSKEKIDIVIMPGLAFARNGYRIGYGLGLYDKLLPNLRESSPAMKSIGLAYNFQVVDNVPRDAHDQKVDAIVTETSIIVSSEARR